MKIGNLKIGYSERPKIIAEIGINHGGSLQTAKKMCELAANNGADIIKTQLHIPSEEMSSEAKKVIPNFQYAHYKISPSKGPKYP